MPFDPAVIRRQLEVFEIGHYREASFAEAYHEHTLNVGGWAMLACGIRCLLVGSIDVGRELVLKASHFLRFAIYQPVEKCRRGIFQPRQVRSEAPHGSQNSDLRRNFGIASVR